MARQKGERVLGLYFQPARGRWHVVVAGSEGGRADSYHETEAEAAAFARIARRRLIAGGRSIAGAIDEYEVFLRTEKENKPGTIKVTTHRLRQFFDGDLENPLTQLDERFGARLYEALRTRVSPKTHKPLSVDTHRNVLAEAKSFLGWCVAKKWIPRNSLAAVAGKGKRRHGKPQLRIDESKAWLKHALDQADNGEEGAIAAMMTLLMNLRCSEIVTRVVRDVDDGGRVL